VTAFDLVNYPEPCNQPSMSTQPGKASWVGTVSSDDGHGTGGKEKMASCA